MILLLTIPQITTLRNIFQITLVAETGVTIYLATQIRETRHQISESTRIKSRAKILDLVGKTSFQGLLGMAFLYFFYYSITNTYIPIYARIDLNLSDAEVASFATYRSLAIMIIRFSSATFLSRAPIKPFLISALALGGITGLVSPFTYNYISIVSVLFLSGISFGAIRILSTTLVARNSTQENRGLANSLLDVSQGIGNFTKTITSPTADNLGIEHIFVLVGVTGLLAIIPVLLRKVTHT